MENFRFNDARERTQLLELLRRSELLRASLPNANVRPLLVCHHYRLPATPESELEQARRDRRPILHLRIERSEAGWLLARLQYEQEPDVQWHGEDGPPTVETIIKVEDGSRTSAVVPALYRYGCRAECEL